MIHTVAKELEKERPYRGWSMVLVAALGSWGKPVPRGHEESRDDALQNIAERTGDFRLLNYSRFNRGGHVEVT